jgi:hypothetical protein
MQHACLYVRVMTSCLSCLLALQLPDNQDELTASARLDDAAAGASATGATVATRATGATGATGSIAAQQAAAAAGAAEIAPDAAIGSAMKRKLTDDDDILQGE